jgi:hypothetical protein
MPTLASRGWGTRGLLGWWGGDMGVSPTQPSQETARGNLDSPIPPSRIEGWGIRLPRRFIGGPVAEACDGRQDGCRDGCFGDPAVAPC